MYQSQLNIELVVRWLQQPEASLGYWNSMQIGQFSIPLVRPFGS